MSDLVAIGAAGADWWDLVPALAGAIVGAIAAAVPAFLLARRSAKEVLARDAVQREEATKALVFSMAVKLLVLYDAAADLRRYLNEWLSPRGDPQREKMEPWQRVPPRLGDLQDAPEFTPDELAVIFADKQYALMQSMMLLQRRTASSKLSFQGYSQRREELKALAPTPQAYSGSIGQTWISPEKLLELKRHTIPLNDLLLGLQAAVEEDWRLSREVIDSFTTLARRHLKMPGFTIQSRDDAAPGAPG
jgi:hypothetical protein